VVNNGAWEVAEGPIALADVTEVNLVSLEGGINADVDACEDVVLGFLAPRVRFSGKVIVTLERRLPVSEEPMKLEENAVESVCEVTIGLGRLLCTTASPALGCEI